MPIASPTQCAPSSVPGSSGLGTAFFGNSLSTNPSATPHNSLNIGNSLSTNPGATPHNSLTFSTIPGATPPYFAQPVFPVPGHQFNSVQSAASGLGDSCSSTQQNPAPREQHGADPFGLESPACKDG